MNETKFCFSCSSEVDKSNFGVNKSRRDGLQTQCRACKKLGQNKWYRNNKTRHVADVAKRRRNAEIEIIKYIINFLQRHPCVDCGEANPVVLEFDHVRGNKRGSICDLIRRGCGWNTVSAEIQKCEVRCCKCHRIKTARQFGYRKMLLTATSGLI